MKKYFAVADPHSFTDFMLSALHKAGFEKDNPEHYVVICGDAFDRGDSSDGMLSWMMEMYEKNRLIYIRGNHDDLLQDCVNDIRRMRHIGYHHVTNGTVKTLATIVGCTQYDILDRTFEWSVFDSKVDELINFINEVAVDYFQLGNTVFVHGWVPTTVSSDNDSTTCVHENWRDGSWREARWENGMEMYKFGIVPPDVTTVVCGHWHASYGWAHIRKSAQEWGEGACFDTFIDYNPDLKFRIVALDACTAYTGKVNCVVFDENGIIIDKNYSV